MKYTLLGLLAGLILFTATLPVLHAQTPEVVTDFTLRNEKKEEIKLSGFATQKAVVVVFTSSNCSWATKYIDRLKAMSEKYAPLGITFLAINSNDTTMSELDAVSRVREGSPYGFPYLKDEDQAVAKLLKATKTPEVVVLQPVNKRFEVLYRGKVDDNPLDAGLVKHNFLQEALDAVLAGKKYEVPVTPPSGCNIRWKDQ